MVDAVEAIQKGLCRLSIPPPQPFLPPSSERALPTFHYPTHHIHHEAPSPMSECRQTLPVAITGPREEKFAEILTFCLRALTGTYCRGISLLLPCPCWLASNYFRLRCCLLLSYYVGTSKPSCWRRLVCRVKPSSSTIALNRRPGTLRNFIIKFHAPRAPNDALKLKRLSYSLNHPCPSLAHPLLDFF